MIDPTARPTLDRLRAQCAQLIGPGPVETVASGLSAALLHGLWLPTWAADRRVDLTVWSDLRASRALLRPQGGAVDVHRRQLRAQDVTVVAGVPVTALERTWFDLAAVLDVPDLVAAGDSALRAGDANGSASMESLAEVCREYRNRRGARRAVTALAMLDARSRSRPESHLRVALRHPDLPEFAVNEAVADDNGEWLAEPDLSLREAKLALEYQGSDHADPERMRKDMTRIADLRRNGWQVLLYGPAEVFQRPQLIAPEVRAILRTRAPQLLIPRRGRTRAAS